MIELKTFYIIMILFVSLSFNAMLITQVIELLKDNEAMKSKLGRTEDKGITFEFSFTNILRRLSR